MIKVIKWSYYYTDVGIGTQLVYETNGVPMSARFPEQISEAVAVKSIEIRRSLMPKREPIHAH